MFRVITQNSVYLVTAFTDGFNVQRVADMWGRAVKNKHFHHTRNLIIGIGSPMVTDRIRTTAVQAVTSAIQPKSKA